MTKSIVNINWVYAPILEQITVDFMQEMQSH